MHILCTICSDLVNQAENIYAIKCGHIFHNHCIKQWIDRSKSCPQCRIKVTERCIFRIYPTVSNENSEDDVTTIQSRLDDVQLQLRQEKSECKEKDKKLNQLELDLKRAEEILKESEKKLVCKSSAVVALKEQLKYVQIQNQETQRLKEENEVLNKNLQTLNGLQKVLNASSDDVEQMLQGYDDSRTLATFATALKRALCDSEKKKNEYRDKLQISKQRFTTEKNKIETLQNSLNIAQAEISRLNRDIKLLQHKTANSSIALFDNSISDSFTIEVPTTATSHSKQKKPSKKFIELIDAKRRDESFTRLVDKIENADSPYLSLKQSSLALTALQRHPNQPLPDENLKPSEFALLNSVKSAVTRKPENTSNSIFHKKETTKIDFPESNANNDVFNISYDGLGGHSKLDIFPVPNTKPVFKSCVPKLTAKHRLKRPGSSSQDLEKYFKKRKDDNE